MRCFQISYDTNREKCIWKQCPNSFFTISKKDNLEEMSATKKIKNRILESCLQVYMQMNWRIPVVATIAHFIHQFKTVLNWKLSVLNKITGIIRTVIARCVKYPYKITSLNKFEIWSLKTFGGIRVKISHISASMQTHSIWNEQPTL